MTGPEVETEGGTHSPPPSNAQRPKGILKNSYRKSPPVSPTTERDVSDKQITIENTNKNAGHRRSSSAQSRPRGYSRAGSQANGDDLQPSQRLQWDEANLYLTEQERTATMKITEPKTPYAPQYEPSDDEDMEMIDGVPSQREEIPGLSLGEPEEEVPERPASASRKQSKVHVHDDDADTSHDAEHEYVGMSAEEREKHLKFERLRKKHYEMKDAAKLLGHSEDAPPEDEDEDEDGVPPPMPTINGAKVKAGD